MPRCCFPSTARAWPTTWYRDAERYDRGFARLVHAAQPKRDQDGDGIRLAWDDEHVAGGIRPSEPRPMRTRRWGRQDIASTCAKPMRGGGVAFAAACRQHRQPGRRGSGDRPVRGRDGDRGRAGTGVARAARRLLDAALLLHLAWRVAGDDRRGSDGCTAPGIRPGLRPPCAWAANGRSSRSATRTCRCATATATSSASDGRSQPRRARGRRGHAEGPDRERTTVVEVGFRRHRRPGMVEVLQRPDRDRSCASSSPSRCCAIPSSCSRQADFRRSTSNPGRRGRQDGKQRDSACPIPMSSN